MALRESHDRAMETPATGDGKIMSHDQLQIESFCSCCEGEEESMEAWFHDIIKSDMDTVRRVVEGRGLAMSAQTQPARISG
ncbi:hypothetical protein MMC31_007293 [Peltigera leucophlebia]|nr:hypothetical protein [Peltigera leucophlebia]